MVAYLLYAGAALYLGVLTSISPCPLATNLAATVWLSRHATSRRRALLGALAYTSGRVAAYGAIAAILAFGALGRHLRRGSSPGDGDAEALVALTDRIRIDTGGSRR